MESNLIWYHENIDLEHKMIIPSSLITIHKMTKSSFIIEIGQKTLKKVKKDTNLPDLQS